MYVTALANVQTIKDLPGIEHKTLAGGADGLKQLSFWQQSIGGGSATPPHRHDCEEVVLVTQGRGELHIGGEVHAFGANSVLIIPPNAEHQIINTGPDTMKVIAAFSTTPVECHFPNGEPIPLPWST
jgi:quercetin dioxygenase-like cupin family protein